MGVQEVKTWHCQCDGRHCSGRSFSITAAAAALPDLPKGWEYDTIKDCGATGYSRQVLYCPYCLSVKRGDQY